MYSQQEPNGRTQQQDPVLAHLFAGHDTELFGDDGQRV